MKNKTIRYFNRYNHLSDEDLEKYIYKHLKKLYTVNFIGDTYCRISNGKSVTLLTLVELEKRMKATIEYIRKNLK